MGKLTVMKVHRLMIIFSVVYAGFLQASTAPSASGCQRLATMFLANPTKITVSALHSENGNACWSVIGLSNTRFNKLLHNVQEGNYWAATYLAENLKRTDGGNLEDALAALGKFSDSDMENFLILAKKGLISEYEFASTVTALPLSMSDNQPAQLAALNIRESKVRQVTRKDLTEQRALALKAIDRFVTEIKATAASG